MKKLYLVILVAAVASCAGGFLARSTLARVAYAGGGPKWEYAVYRIGSAGVYRYEWQDADERIYARTARVFLEKMGFLSGPTELGRMTDAPQSVVDRVLEVELFNHLGNRGWELVDVVDKGPGGIPNRTFWFKRPR